MMLHRDFGELQGFYSVRMRCFEFPPYVNRIVSKTCQRAINRTMQASLRFRCRTVRTSEGERQVGETNERRFAATGSTFVLLRDESEFGHGR